jgi:hypothetical protein
VFALVAITGCAAAPFAEGDPPDEECGGISGFGGGNGTLLEVGRLQGGTFVPLVGGETLELSVTGDPYGWAITAALRYPVESPPMRRDGCLSIQTTPMGPGAVTSAASPGHPATWVEDPQTPSIGRWTSDGEAHIVVGTDLTMLLAAPVAVTIGASIEGYAQRTSELMLRFTNTEGFLAD